MNLVPPTSRTIFLRVAFISPHLAYEIEDVQTVSLEKTLGEFHLTSGEGAVHRSEVVGVVALTKEDVALAEALLERALGALLRAQLTYAAARPEFYGSLT